MLPNILTLSRIFIIPIIVVCFYIDSTNAKYIGAILYILACVTDFLDGYLARQWHQISGFGKFCDPVADKVLVSITVFMIAGVGVIHGIHLIAAAVILAREILVSGLRSYLGQIQKVLPVTNFAKWKTAIQMCSIAALLLYIPSEVKLYYVLGIMLLWLAAILTTITGYWYLKNGFKYIEFSPHK